MYGTEESIPEPEHKLFCVKVGKIQRGSLYEMTRKYWKASLEKASKSTYVLAIKDGRVIAVYKPIEWRYTENVQYKGRIEFVGTEVLDSNYIGKDVRTFYRRGASNPVKYINF